MAQTPFPGPATFPRVVFDPIGADSGYFSVALASSAHRVV
ncbi:hypothetical protein DLNHIDIE_01776 [Acidithiobacillus thiooxidans ATCC 19377]|uniref:Uncharacterized protein n=1 Tax=Acidithiobacillus thiooxidans ATCC 19377 TaxID=637390 RepID=A0A543Q6E9_ACITH|nr:hypothetical protein DLNHIDIE_01776 [Acidithiobacillus thiooxidans ATCC 19377]